jgi:hypothetical protein
MSHLSQPTSHHQTMDRRHENSETPARAGKRLDSNGQRRFLSVKPRSGNRPLPAFSSNRTRRRQSDRGRCDYNNTDQILRSSTASRSEL